MQKSHVRGRASTIALAVLTIVCCVSLIIGATLAIFSSRQDNNISFTSGELKVETDITIADAWSYATDGGNGGTSVSADGTTVDFGSGTGTMTLDQETGSMTFEGVAPGDGVSLDLAIQNSGDINAMYIVKLTGTIPAELSFRMGRTSETELTEKNGEIIVQSWSALAAGNTASVVGLVIELPHEAEEAVEANFTLTIEAVQANAFTPDEDEDDLIPSAADGTVLVSGIEGGAKVMELSKAVTDYLGKQNADTVTVTFAEGTYTVSTALAVESGGNVVLQGAGAGKTILQISSGQTNLGALFIGKSSNVTVRNLTIEKTAGEANVAAVKVTVSGQGGDGSSLANSDNFSKDVILENLEIIDSGNGHGIDINGAENVTIDNLAISGYGKAGIAYKNAQNVTIANVTFNGSEEDTPWSDIYDNNAASDTSSQNIVLGNGIEFSGITFTVSILSHNAPIYALYHDGSLNISGYEKYNLAIDDTYSGYGIALISPAVVTVTDAAGEVSSYIGFADALAAVNKIEGTDQVTIALRGNTSVAANNAATITRDNVVLDGNGYTIDFGETNVSGQAALHVRANNVTVRNVTLTNSGTNGNVATLKYSFASNGAEISNGVIEDVVINANGAGHGLNLHGSNNVTVNRVDVSNFGKVGIAIASAADIEISYTTFATDVYSAWANIGIMWADSDNYRKNTTGVVLGDGNVFCDTNPVIYNEEPDLPSSVGEESDRVVSGYEQYGYTLVWRDNTTGTGYEIGTASYETADGNTYVSLATAVAASEGNPVTLTESTTYRGAAFPLYTAPEAGAATFSAKSEVSGSATVIDLGGNTLTAYVTSPTIIEGAGSSLTIRNGSLHIEYAGNNGVGAVIAPKVGGIATIANVNYTTNGAALYPEGSAAEVNVINSTITAPIYAVGTNAGDESHYGIKIRIEGSTLTTTDVDSLPVLINIPDSLEIKDSTLQGGGRQGLIVRGGSATVENTTITTLGTYSGNTYLDRTWGSGNEVPLAAVVVGDRSNAYKYPATLTMTNVSVYAYGNADTLYMYGDSAEYYAALTLNGGNVTAEDVTVGGGYVTINGQAYATAEDIEAIGYWLQNEQSVIVDGEEIGFAGGKGTEESPFLVTTQQQFENVGFISAIAAENVDAAAWYANPYYTIANNIAVDSSFEGFTYINGKFAGAEGDTKVKLDLSATTSGLAVDGFGDLSFSDLEFVSGGGMMVGFVNYYAALRAYGTDVLFSNVTTSGQAGEVTLTGSNQSAFVAQVFNCNFTMINCVNNADVYGSYGAAFIGGYALYSKVTLTDCVNNGNIFCASAALILGNDFVRSEFGDCGCPFNTSRFSFRGIVNNGTITGTKRANLFIGMGGGSEHDESNEATYGSAITNNGSLVTTNVTGSVTVSEDGTISATYTDTGDYTVTSARVYLFSYLTTTRLDGTSPGTLLTYYDADNNATAADGTVTTSLKRYNVVDFRTAGVTDLTAVENASIDGIMKGTLGDDTVYYVSEGIETSGFPLEFYKPLQVSQTATSITPTVAVYLYAGDMVVGILTK